MLIISRKVAETITIGDDITVTILGVSGHQVRLGIYHPEGVKVHKGEAEPDSSNK